ncbi:MAG: dihydropteroate synthase [Pseudomonadales bacterium]|nr:dihydropteroate synthase [Pseudomonadales bacterium]
MKVQCASRRLDLGPPAVMGVLNITPDSFSDGGQFYQSGLVDLDRVEARAREMIEAGAAILDIGGESTRPNASVVGEQEELRRVIPVIERLRKMDVILSVDTSKAVVASAAIKSGVHMINDVCALSRPGMLDCVADSDVGVCLMHMQGQPDNMQLAPQYNNVTRQVSEYLGQRIEACLSAGIGSRRLIIDPGFGFGKTPVHNYQMLKQLADFKQLSLPILIGVSRKSMLRNVVGSNPAALTLAGACVAQFACERGASIIRTHDVHETITAIQNYLGKKGDSQEPLQLVTNQPSGHDIIDKINLSEDSKLLVSAKQKMDAMLMEI